MNTNANTNANSNANYNIYSNTNSNTDTISLGHANTNTNTDSNTNTNPNTNPMPLGQVPLCQRRRPPPAREQEAWGVEAERVRAGERAGTDDDEESLGSEGSHEDGATCSASPSSSRTWSPVGSSSPESQACILKSTRCRVFDLVAL